MKAMILAAGKGTRLGELSTSNPKILVDLGGMTLLEWILGKLKHYGFSDIIINVHHLADKVESAAVVLAKKVGVDISFSDEREVLLDTGGGLFKAKSFFDDKPFLLYNGDIVSDLDLGALYRRNIGSGAIATLAMRHRPGKRFFLVNESGVLTGWVNRESGEEIIVSPGAVRFEEIAFSAISVIKPKIFNYMVEGIYSMRSVYLDIAKSNPVNSFKHDSGTWIDIGSIAQLEECRHLFNELSDTTLLY